MQPYSVSTAVVASLGSVPGPEVFWMQHFNEWLPMEIHVVLIQGNGKNILVNSGPPEDYLDRMNAVWREELGEKAHIAVAHPGALHEVLRKWGLSYDDIDAVIVTPLQAYAIGGIDLFPRAEICISRTGWVDLVAPKHFDARRPMAVPDRLLHWLLIDAWPQQRIRLLEDEDTVVPGIRTWWAGTHHRSSLAVEVKTAKGIVAVSDVAFYYENLEKNIPLGIMESLEECRVAYDRLRQSDAFVSLYDPKTSIKYPGGQVVG